MTKMSPRYLFLLLILVVLNGSAFQLNGRLYDGWQVVEVSGLSGPSELETLLSVTDDEYMMEELFLQKSGGVGQYIISPEIKKRLLERTKQKALDLKIIIEDVGSLIRRESLEYLVRSDLNGTTTFSRYLSLDEIYAYLNAVSENFSKASVSSIGTTHEGRDIKMITISADLNNTDKPVIFIESGIHAREWITPASAMYVIEQLINDDKWTQLFEWRIVVSSNPDGYEYTWNTDRLWRKNRKPSISRPSRCIGVDLNRNFDYDWAGIGASSHPCSSTYRGYNVFSEKESQAIRDAALQVKNRLRAYWSFHSYSQVILFPFGSLEGIIPPKNKIYHKDLVRKMSEKIYEAYNTTYTFGEPRKIMYPAAGLSQDWAFDALNVPAFTAELRDTGKFGFILPANLILPSVKEAWMMLDVLATELSSSNLRSNGINPQDVSMPSSTRPIFLRKSVLSSDEDSSESSNEDSSESSNEDSSESSDENED